MHKTLLYVILTFLSFQAIKGQDHRDWPSSLNYYSLDDTLNSTQICAGIGRKDREIISETFGREYYCNGNVHAEGGLKKSRSRTIYYAGSDKKALSTLYLRNGDWKVYFDSTKQILRSEGSYKEGEKDGKWMIYDKDGKTRFEIEFEEGQTKTKVKINQVGKREVIIQKSNLSLFVERNETLLTLLSLLPITLLRIGWNILTYNMVHGTSYVPFFQNWQKGGMEVNINSTIIFWWVIKSEDEKEVRRYKRIANWISIFSIICLAAFALLTSLNKT